MAKLTNKKTLDQLKQKVLAKHSSNWIKIGYSTCGIAAGADVVWKTLCEEAEKRNIDIEIKKVGCAGMCYAEPLVEVNVEGMPRVFYGKVDKDTAVKIMDKHVGRKLLVKDHIYNA